MIFDINKAVSQSITGNNMKDVIIKQDYLDGSFGYKTSNNINKITVSGKTYDITPGTFSSSNYDDIFEEMKKRFNMTPIVHHNCHNCGGRLELREDEHIFNCPYCGSVYAVGIQQINSKI